jgi:hypothetical protein
MIEIFASVKPNLGHSNGFALAGSVGLRKFHRRINRLIYRFDLGHR